jgi:osmotically-inducible protein OsmY
LHVGFDVMRVAHELTNHYLQQKAEGGTMADWYRDEDQRRTRGYGSGDDQGYRQQERSSGRDRGMIERGSDEVRSWMGDDEAERRRQRDQQRDARGERQDMPRSREGGSRTPSWREMGDGEESESPGESSALRQSASTYRPTTFTYTEIWAIPGPYAGQGPQGYQRSNDRIKEDVCERLTQHGHIDATNIEVSVSNGEVTLRGTVENREMKRRAEDAVESVSGVQDVRNELRATGRQNGQANQQTSQRSAEKTGDNEKQTSKQERNRVPS